jgi:hypothetical protein
MRNLSSGIAIGAICLLLGAALGTATYSNAADPPKAVATQPAAQVAPATPTQPAVTKEDVAVTAIGAAGQAKTAADAAAKTAADATGNANKAAAAAAAADTKAAAAVRDAAAAKATAGNLQAQINSMRDELRKQGERTDANFAAVQGHLAKITACDKAVNDQMIGFFSDLKSGKIIAEGNFLWWNDQKVVVTNGQGKVDAGRTYLQGTVKECDGITAPTLARVTSDVTVTPVVAPAAPAPKPAKTPKKGGKS